MLPRFRIILIILIFIFSNDILLPQEKNNVDDMLKNLKGIRIKILRLNKEIKNKGITENLVQKTVEDTLLLSGLGIINNESWKKDPSKASLSVQMVMNRSNNLKFYNVNIYVHIKQMSIMKRSRKDKDLEITWFRSPMLHIREENLKTEIIKGLKNVIGDFLSAYQNSSNALTSE